MHAGMLPCRAARSLELGPSAHRRRRVPRRGRVVLERGGTGAEQQGGQEDDGEAEGAERRDEDEGAWVAKGGGTDGSGGESLEHPRQRLAAQWVGLVLGVPS